MRQVTTVIEAHAQDRVARLYQGEIGSGVCLRAGMRLHVRVIRTEERLGAIDRELLRDVDVFAAAVITLAGISFGVLVGQHGALRLEHPRAGVILGGNELNVLLLAMSLALDRLEELWVETFDGHRRPEHARTL